MSTAWMLQIVADVAIVLGLVVTWIRLNRPAQDDPRLSRGLQLLQSKIAVLEDLSDRTDAQVKQLNTLIEQKSRLLQNKIIESEHQIRRVDQSMHKSKEVAEIFQDKIPHQEIIERQNTIKYVKAAKLANAGKSVAEIAAAVDLPMVQIELIAKLNKDQLVFDEQALPEWAQKSEAEAILNFGSQLIEEAPVAQAPLAIPAGGDLATLFEPPKEEYASLKRLGEEFRNACIEFDRKRDHSEVAAAGESEDGALTMAPSSIASVEDPSALYEGAKKVTSKIVASASDFLQHVENKAKTFIEAPVVSAVPPTNSAAAVTVSSLAASASPGATLTETLAAAMSSLPGAPTGNGSTTVPLSGSSLKQNPPSLTTTPQPAKPAPVRTGAVEVRKVEFPRVNVNHNLR